MSYAEQVEENHRSKLEALKKSIENAHQEIALRRRLGVIFDELTAENKPVYDWVGTRFEFRFTSIEKARSFMDGFLEKLGIEKAEKGFEGWGEHPVWYYEVEFEGQRIKVEPAEPSADCKPVAVASSSVHWVCERI